MSTTVSPTTISAREFEQMERANATAATPVVFIHGLWLLPSSWDSWATLFGKAGYVALTPDWPDDPPTVQGARAEPKIVAGTAATTLACKLLLSLSSVVRRD